MISGARKRSRRLIAWLISFLVFLTAVSPVFAAEFVNPLRWDSLQDFIAAVLRAVVMIALPFITLAFVAVGFQFLFAQGEETKLKNARKNFLWAVIGALLVMGAWTIATLIAGTVVQLVGK